MEFWQQKSDPPAMRKDVTSVPEERKKRAYRRVETVDTDNGGARTSVHLEALRRPAGPAGSGTTE